MTTQAQEQTMTYRQQLIQTVATRLVDAGVRLDLRAGDWWPRVWSEVHLHDETAVLFARVFDGGIAPRRADRFYSDVRRAAQRIAFQRATEVLKARRPFEEVK